MRALWFVTSTGRRNASDLVAYGRGVLAVLEAKADPRALISAGERWPFRLPRNLRNSSQSEETAILHGDGIGPDVSQPDAVQQFNGWCTQWHMISLFLLGVVSGLCPLAAGPSIPPAMPLPRANQ